MVKEGVQERASFCGGARRDCGALCLRSGCGVFCFPALAGSDGRSRHRRRKQLLRARAGGAVQCHWSSGQF
eukprot:12906335-Prorocentrum_lima.AAC.1